MFHLSHILVLKLFFGHNQSRFYMWAFRNQNFMVTWFTNLKNYRKELHLLFLFRNIIIRYSYIGYNLNVMRQSSFLVFNPIMFDNYAASFNCTSVALDSMVAQT